MNGDQSLPADFRGIIEECAHRAVEEGAEGAPESERFRVISDEVGLFLYMLARAANRTSISDMGGLGGASSSIVWLAGAACRTDGEVIAWEANPRRLLKLQNCLSRARLAPNVELICADPLWSFEEDEGEPAQPAQHDSESLIEKVRIWEGLDTLDAGSDMSVASLVEPDWNLRMARAWDLLEPEGIFVLTDTLLAGESTEARIGDFFGPRPAATVSFPLGEGVLVAYKLPDETLSGARDDSMILGGQAHEVLEDLQTRNRKPGSRLWAIPPETGRFLWIIIRSMAAKRVLEIGASGGYSGTWIAKALETSGGTLTTMDLDPDKVALARETYSRAGVADRVEIIPGDARDIVPTLEGQYDLVFLDCDKEFYLDLLEPILWRLRRGGLLIADNVLSHGELLKSYVDEVQHHPSLASLTLPIGSGEEMTMVL